MKKTNIFLLILAWIFVVSCSNNNDNEKNNSSCTSDSCQEWEICSDSGVCELASGRCNTNEDCSTNNETCDATSHFCKTVPECTVNEDCIDSEKPICDNGICVKNTSNCNIDKTPSDTILSSDSCGELTNCIDSSDCPENMRCENLKIKNADYTRACCVEGPRGCKTTGETCEDEFDCESGLCMAKNDGQHYCTKQCTDNNDCIDPVSFCKDMTVMKVCTEP